MNFKQMYVVNIFSRDNFAENAVTTIAVAETEQQAIDMLLSDGFTKGEYGHYVNKCGGTCEIKHVEFCVIKEKINEI